MTFWRGEPVLYHPPHMAKPVFTHISCITNSYFVVGSTTTECMIPFKQAQQVLKLKLDIADIEREVDGNELEAPERLLWRRWVEVENMRASRKSRVRAPCCGRYKFRYQLEPDENGELWCVDCWALPTQVCDTLPIPEAVAPNPNEPSDYPWRQKDLGEVIAPPPSKRYCGPLRGVVERGCPDGSYYLAALETIDEKVIVHKKDCLTMHDTSWYTFYAS